MKTPMQELIEKATSSEDARDFIMDVIDSQKQLLIKEYKVITDANINGMKAFADLPVDFQKEAEQYYNETFNK